MKEIVLTNHDKPVLVDDEDYERLIKYRWTYGGGDVPERNYAIRNYRIGDDDWTHRRMHRMILNAKKRQIIDHIDGNRLNNQKSNLRICTNAENIHNQTISKNNKTGYKGVRFNKALKKYQGQICHDKKVYYLGTFDNPIDCALAYNQMALKLYGKFARLNNVCV